MIAFSLFPTAIGPCAIAWRGDTVVATFLPERTPEATAARLVGATGAVEGAPPRTLQDAIDAITALLDGTPIDLGHIDCDFTGADAFSVRVYSETRTIASGQTRTYGEIAAALGDRRLSRAVGRALGRNPVPIIVPCHRVVGAGQRLTGFSAPGGVATKLRILAIEGAAIGRAGGLFGDLPLSVRPPR